MMIKPVPTTIEDRLQNVQLRWDGYAQSGSFDQFVEFAVAINALTEHFKLLRLPGLIRLCEGLENTALDMLGEQHTHPLAAAEHNAISRQLTTLQAAVASLRAPVLQQRTSHSEAMEESWVRQRTVWMRTAPQRTPLAAAVARQLEFFGFKTLQQDWTDPIPVPTDVAEQPLAVIFVTADTTTSVQEFQCIADVRTHCPTSQLIYLGEQAGIEPVVALMRSGIDITIPVSDEPSLVLNCILDMVQSSEQEKSRVLIVEDSRVAATVIQRTLKQNDIDTHILNDPATLLEVLETYRPDLVLMDMYMPRFNGVEATRVLRQMPCYHSLPIVYVSGESEISMQVEALRLGGDQFLIKPFNPVLLAAVVKTKIERYRESQRSSTLDGLTGLLNHTSVKSRLKVLLSQTVPGQPLTVVMLDIDHFKSVNDSYGHPVGDQVIRGMAWLLKGRLRSHDLIGRYGGEEFLIALPGVTTEQAMAVMNRIRNDFAALPHVHAQGSFHATFSAGVATLRSDDDAISLTERADYALLEAKRLGRNRVERSAGN